MLIENNIFNFPNLHENRPFGITIRRGGFFMHFTTTLLRHLYQFFGNQADDFCRCQNRAPALSEFNFVFHSNGDFGKGIYSCKVNQKTGIFSMASTNESPEKLDFSENFGDFLIYKIRDKATMISILTLETAIISQFGSMENPVFYQGMIGMVSGAVCVFVLVAAISMIVRASKQLASHYEE